MFPNRVERALEIAEQRGGAKYRVLIRHHNRELPTRAVGPEAVVLAAPELETVTAMPIVVVVIGGVAAIAGIKKAVELGIIKPNETVTTIVTGNGLKDPVNGQKAVSMPEPMAPSLEELDKFLKDKGAI